METTKDGFTFTRRAPNKQVGPSCEKMKAAQTQKGVQKSVATLRSVEDEFVFNRVLRNPRPAAKKRRTIQMEPSIDISTEEVSLLQPYMEPSASAPARSNRDRAPQAEVPVQKGRSKSHEIYRRVLSSNINDLIKECVHFLRDDTDYAKEIIKHCNSNYFSDIDYRKEIELANSKNDQIKGEIDKWNKILLEEKALNAVSIPEIVDVAAEEMDNGTERLVDEFEGKARRLLDLEGKLQYFFENAREKSDGLLKSIFGSLEEKSVDAIFLLRAMSKLGR